MRLWNSWWSTNDTKQQQQYDDTDVNVATADPLPSLAILMVDGATRVPGKFPIDGTNVMQVRRWVFKSVAHDSEKEEEYVFKILVAGEFYTVLWYNIISQNQTYGVVTRFNPRTGCFVDLTGTEQIVLPQQQQQQVSRVHFSEPVQQPPVQTTVVAPIKKKRGRPRKNPVIELK